MKHVVINVGKTEYGVASLGDDLKPLPNEWEVGIMLSVAIDRMIEFGYSKKWLWKLLIVLMKVVYNLIIAISKFIWQLLLRTAIWRNNNGKN